MSQFSTHQRLNAKTTEFSLWWISAQVNIQVKHVSVWLFKSCPGFIVKNVFSLLKKNLALTGIWTLGLGARYAIWAISLSFESQSLPIFLIQYIFCLYWFLNPGLSDPEADGRPLCHRSSLIAWNYKDGIFDELPKILYIFTLTKTNSSNLFSHLFSGMIVRIEAIKKQTQ